MQIKSVLADLEKNADLDAFQYDVILAILSDQIAPLIIGSGNIPTLFAYHAIRKLVENLRNQKLHAQESQQPTIFGEPTEYPMLDTPSYTMAAKLAVSTMVFNLATGEEVYYSLPPEDAVIVAYLQHEKGDYNTWDYDLEAYRPQIVKGQWSVSMGNWAAVTTLPKPGFMEDHTAGLIRGSELSNEQIQEESVLRDTLLKELNDLLYELEKK
jgi:predicted nucleic acid-binding protein